MSKTEYLEALKQRLCDYPTEETEKFISYYSEIIDDRIEDGSTEEEAVASLGDVESVASTIKSEMPMSAIVKSNVKAKMNNNDSKKTALIIVLLVLGFPIWFSLLVAAVSIVCTFFICMWSIILSFWCVFASFAAGSLAALCMSAVLIFTGGGLMGVYYLGIAFILCGLSIGCFWLSRLLTTLAIKGCRGIFRAVKKSMVKNQEEIV